MVDEITKTDSAFKHILGVEFTSPDKATFEETGSGGTPDHINDLFAESIDVSPAQAIIDGVIEEFSPLKLTVNSTVVNGKSWYTCLTPGDLNTQIKNFVNPNKYGAAYLPTLWEDNGAGTAPDYSKQVLPSAIEWMFFTRSGVWYIPQGFSGLAIPFWASNLFHYIGKFGVSGAILEGNFLVKDLTAQIPGTPSKSYVTPDNYVSGSLEIFINGLHQGTQTLSHFTETGTNTFDLEDVLVSGEELIVKFLKED